jgi:phytanoyl-CoA hydroxylase
MLDRAALTAYERDGFLLLEGFAPPERCDALIARAREIVAALVGDSAGPVFSAELQHGTEDEYFLTSGDKVRLFFDAGDHARPVIERVNKIGHALHDIDPVFDTFSRDPRLAETAADVGMARPLLLQSTVIFKQAYTGGEVVPHQDSAYLYTEPPSCLGMWFALQDADLENGCLWAISGGHRLPVTSRYRRLPEGGARFDPPGPPTFPEVAFRPLPARRGSLLLLHGSLPHRSGDNRSSRSRHAYTLHLIDGACCYPEDNWLRRGPDMPLRGF